MSMSFLLSLFVTIVIAGLVFWLLWWFIDFVGLPEPFNKVARVLIGLFAIIFVLSLLIAGPSHPILGNWR